MLDLTTLKAFSKAAALYWAYGGTQFSPIHRSDYGTWNTKTFPQGGTLPKRSSQHG